MTTPAFEDPTDERNGPKYHTGKLCIEGCGRPAGTAWSPLWCHPCNVVRMNRITASLTSMLIELEAKAVRPAGGVKP